jgi:hypothetical protein
MRPFWGSDGGDSDQLDLVWVDSLPVIHTVILQLTKAKLGDRVLEDRVVYVCQGRDPARVRVQRVPASVLPPLSGHPGLL